MENKKINYKPEEDQSVNQARYPVVWKLLINTGADQPLDVDQCQSALL